MRSAVFAEGRAIFDRLIKQEGRPDFWGGLPVAESQNQKFGAPLCILNLDVSSIDVAI
jgi:hypothetical protein